MSSEDDQQTRNSGIISRSDLPDSRFHPKNPLEISGFLLVFLVIYTKNRGVEFLKNLRPTSKNGGEK
jgi:hypothetical protein